MPSNFYPNERNKNQKRVSLNNLFPCAVQSTLLNPNRPSLPTRGPTQSLGTAWHDDTKSPIDQSWDQINERMMPTFCIILLIIGSLFCFFFFIFFPTNLKTKKQLFDSNVCFLWIVGLIFILLFLLLNN